MATDVAPISAPTRRSPAVVALGRAGAVPVAGERRPDRPAAPFPERVDVAPLQRIVDGLAASLGRPVLLDDANLRLLAHSHQGDQEVDRVRLASILQRSAPAAVVRHLRREGIDRLQAPTRIAGGEELDMAPRLCCPVRWNGGLLGYLWLVDDREPLRRAEVEECEIAVREIAALLHEEEFLVHSSRRLQRRLLLGLLTGPPEEVERSTIEIHRLNLLAPTCPVAVLVAEARGATGPPLPDAVRNALDSATERCSRLLPPRHALAGVHDDRAILLLALEPERSREDVARLAGRLHAFLDDAFARIAGWTPIVGVGSFVDDLARTHASYDDACAAARVAHAIDDHGPVAQWDRLGVFRALSAIPHDRVSGLADIHEGLAALAAAPTGDSLIATAETYLDLGADARAAASALHLHRSSLYYRLSKCEAVAGVNLRDGGDRLGFHLALKLARLSGHLDGAGARN